MGDVDLLDVSIVLKGEDKTVTMRPAIYQQHVMRNVQKSSETDVITLKGVRIFFKPKEKGKDSVT